MRHTVTDHILGAALCIVFAFFAGATLYHQYAVDSDTVVQSVTAEALAGK